MNLTNRFKAFLQDIKQEFYIPDELMTTITTGYAKQNEAKEAWLRTYKSKIPIRPSNALTCGRKLWYEMKNFQKPGSYPTPPMSVRQSRVFSAGDMFENFELKKLSSIHNLKISHRQESFKIMRVDGQDITGSIDALLWKDDKSPVLLDIKTITTYQYSDLLQAERPKPENFAQLTLYFHSKGYQEFIKELNLQREPDNQIDFEKLTCGLFYINKDTLEYFLVEFRPDKQVFDMLIKRFEKILEAAKTDEPLPRDFVAPDKFPCGKYCAFQKYCIKTDRADKAVIIADDFNVKRSDVDIIYELWQRYGSSSVYENATHTLTVKPLATKWSLVIEEKPSPEIEIPSGAKKVKKARGRKLSPRASKRPKAE